MTTNALPGWPSTVDHPINVLPGGTSSAHIGIAVPPQALGQRATATVEATPAGAAGPDLLFFEGTLPGGVTAPPEAGWPTDPSSAPVVPLGTWAQTPDRVVRRSRFALGAVTAGGRSTTLELTVANAGDQPLQEVGVSLQVLAGSDLGAVASVRLGVGDNDDNAVAPGRAVTQTLHVTVPASAARGPFVVAVSDDDGTASFRVPADA
ncbi:NEW3 domain-containing protein [Streptomyces sp. SL13]|uniref:NEW3 domain-containing protein n=1 Tax=Streptantibioticus silvisoli TaxID=2705255 RepID=A0AA90GZL4_9ACTN|nr:NEW3 domain-containing protein [Streptantibioticus silvisoli]MDI5969411.1 NEW3 domain-containing protein [Streptantibioticus silvisoli]